MRTLRCIIYANDSSDTNQGCVCINIVCLLLIILLLKCTKVLYIEKGILDFRIGWIQQFWGVRPLIPQQTC